MFAVHSILTPVDLTDPSVQTLEVALRLAESMDADLHLLHVASTPLLTPMFELAAASIGASPVAAAEIEHDAAEHVERFIHRNYHGPGNRLRTSVVIGGVVPEVLKFAARNGIGLIVMGTRAHGLVSRLMRGSISESILERAPCPVLLVPHRDE